MQINVSQLLKSPIGSTRNYELDEVIEGDGSNYRVYGKVNLTSISRSILVRGTLHTEIVVTCSRCLNLFSYPLTLTIEEEYFPTIDVVSGIPLPLLDGPGCFTIDAHHILDLTEAIQQYVIMLIPMKPLCHEDCSGLCPTCGHNLNEGLCGCPPQEIDDRWAELKKLMAVRQPAKRRKETE
jgi:uncharacterized protein